MSGVEHIVDSYEIYGENMPDDESEEDYVDISKNRNTSN